MKKMTNGRVTLNIVEHIILRNLWEYYITDNIPVEGNSYIREALVMGIETELGDFSFAEIKPYIISRDRFLDVFPAPGWSWLEE